MSYLVVTGPTATGKTRRAVSLARHLKGEIISADSRQVFKGMDLGSGKDIGEYGDVAYHLIDIRPAGYKYNLFEFLNDERQARKKILSAGHMPILCGGTGLYVESVLRGVILPEVPVNPALREQLAGLEKVQLAEILGSMKTLHNVTDLDTKQRTIRAIEIAQYYLDNPEIAKQATDPKPITDAVIVGIDVPREVRRERITTRLKSRLSEGMIEEVMGLLNNGVPTESLLNYGLEYKFITQHLMGMMSFEEMSERLEIAIHQFAKRQMTWFRGMERRGFKINWLPYNMEESVFCNAVEELLKSNQ